MDQDIQAQLDKQAQENSVALEQALKDESLTGKKLEIDLLATKQVVDDEYLARVRGLLAAGRYFYKEHKANVVGGVIVIGVKTEVAVSDGMPIVLKELKDALKSLDGLLVGPPRLIFKSDLRTGI